MFVVFKNIIFGGCETASYAAMNCMTLSEFEVQVKAAGCVCPASQLPPGTPSLSLPLSLSVRREQLGGRSVSQRPCDILVLSVLSHFLLYV